MIESSPLRRLGRSYARAFSGLPGEVWILAVATLVNRAGTMVLPFLTLYLTGQFGWSPAAAGRMLALYGAGAIGGGGGGDDAGGGAVGGQGGDADGGVRVGS